MIMKSERIFFIIMVIIAIILFFSLSSCAILDKTRTPVIVDDVLITTPIVNPTSQELVSFNEKNF